MSNKERTQGGVCHGYLPEFFHDDKWRAIPVSAYTNRPGFGIPYPAAFGGLHMFTGTVSEHQAIAIANAFAAEQEAEGRFFQTVRVVKCKITYNFEVERCEPDQTEGKQ